MPIMLLQDQFPSVSDEQIYSELFAAGRRDEDMLRQVFTPGMLALAATIGNFVSDSANDDTFQTAAHYHPVNHDIPFTSVPPNVSFPLPEDGEVAQNYLKGCLEEHASEVSEENALFYPRSHRHAEHDEPDYIKMSAL